VYFLWPHLPAKANAHHHVPVGLLALPISDSPSHPDGYRDSGFIHSETYSPAKARERDYSCGAAPDFPESSSGFTGFPLGPHSRLEEVEEEHQNVFLYKELN
jgi:hypothetical protein